jgi:hypothetical protein
MILEVVGEKKDCLLCFWDLKCEVRTQELEEAWVVREYF